MASLYLQIQMQQHYKKNEPRYIKEHPGEPMVLTTDFKEYFFKTEFERNKFLDPEAIEALKKGKKVNRKLEKFGTPPLCKKIPDPNSKQLKQLDLPLEFRL